MSNNEYLKGFYNLMKRSKLTVEQQQAAKSRESQKRKRKEKLYSFTPEKIVNI